MPVTPLPTPSQRKQWQSSRHTSSVTNSSTLIGASRFERQLGEHFAEVTVVVDGGLPGEPAAQNGGAVDASGLRGRSVGDLPASLCEAACFTGFSRRTGSLVRLMALPSPSYMAASWDGAEPPSPLLPAA